MMRIFLISATDLDAQLQATWRAFQRENPALHSPYYCPEFTRAVAAVRPDVRVAVIEDAGAVIGFFPHQAIGGRGLPVGGALSDHHGVVCEPTARWDWRDLLRACALCYWQFDHLPLAQAPAQGASGSDSPGLDLSRGFEAYRASRRATGARHITELDRKARKLAREVGPLRFEPHVTDRRVLDTVLRLKSQQCLRTATPDFFAWAWARALVERICATQETHFAGRLSALYAGDTLVSAHLGMRSPWVWHWWFPVYDRAHAAHSPGGQLLLQVARAAADQGQRLLELGKGDDRYKQSFADCSLPLAEGWVRRPSVTTAWQALRQTTGRWLRSSPLLQPARHWIKRALRPASSQRA